MKKRVLIFILSFAVYLWSERQIYIAKRVTKEITIDGNITEEEWGKTPTIKTFYRAGAVDKKVNSNTIVWIKYDDNYLYIAGKMEDKCLIGYVDKHDGPVWNDDVLEIFIKPKFKSTHYYEIDTNILGTLFDGFFHRKGVYYLKNIERFSSEAKVAIKINGTLNNDDVDEGWEIEIAIPFSTFSTTNPPKKGDVWYFAICRYDYSIYIPYGKELTSSAKLRRPDFHLYYDYDKLLFK
ncbi:MAG: carbohydrate-binding family 9-like protein [Candidatus Omnitrophica bacterium]|nr:carbohydrate-binding family 9-like protein [Candidatus Omnitrophota bacterium]MCM8803345.1 carbohydrate-binding family 9-like protein [Candidatus Omnitrophota bacterium]